MQELKKYELEETIKSVFTSFNNNNQAFEYNFKSTSTDDTKKLGYIFAKNMNEDDILILNGELGSGKTVFMLGFANFFDIENQVSSPTFTIVNEYITKDANSIYHFDVYRIKSVDEFVNDIGTDYFYDGICVIEWGNIIKDILPKKSIYIDILKDEDDENIRYFHIWRK